MAVVYVGIIDHQWYAQDAKFEYTNGRYHLLVYDILGAYFFRLCLKLF